VNNVKKLIGFLVATVSMGACATEPNMQKPATVPQEVKKKVEEPTQVQPAVDIKVVEKIAKIVEKQEDEKFLNLFLQQQKNQL